MTLSDVLSREMIVEWHEAVALVRAVAERLDEEADGVPELHQIELLVEGEVELHGGIFTADPAQRLGQVLHLLLTRADPPVQLRLLMAQGYDSLEAFSGALAFFERPDRVTILQALYDRASAAAPGVTPDVLDASFMPLQQEHAVVGPAEVESFSLRRRLSYAAAMVLVLVAVGTAYAVARNAEVDSSSRGAQSITTRVADGVNEAKAAVGSMVAAIGESVGIGARAPDPTPPLEPSKAPEQVTAVPRTRSSVRSPKNDTASLQSAAVSAFDLDPSRTAVMPDSDVSSSPPLRVEERVVRSQEGVIYSKDSPGVSAPIGIRPQLPKQLPPGIMSEDLARIELTILPDGTVDSVKLIGLPRTIHDSMLLSAAKAWQFHPAMKDGVPVRYRKTIWVAR